MVQRYIRLLTGRLQVRILLAELFELEISLFLTYRLRRESWSDHQSVSR